MSTVGFIYRVCHVVKQIKMDVEMSLGSQHLLWSKCILGLLEAFKANIHTQRIHIRILPREGFGDKIPMLLEKIQGNASSLIIRPAGTFKYS